MSKNEKPELTNRNVAWTMLITGLVAVTGCGSRGEAEKSNARYSDKDQSQGRQTGNLEERKNPNDLYYNSVAIPSFVDLPKFKNIGGGLESATFRLTTDRLQAGKSCKISIIRPQGRHESASLPCYFLAAAGATLFSGRDLGEGDSAELKPWAAAGFVAVGYEMDGQLNDQTAEAVLAAMQQYGGSQAGLVNARNAVEFVLAKIPEVDPERLYTGGHSSAGSQSLLLAAFDSRIKAAISFNGVIDKIADLKRDAGQEFASLPQDWIRFLRTINPRRYESRIKCPVFLFHTQEDKMVSVLNSQNAYQRLKRQGNDVVLEIGHGSHYQPMISDGIPKAIQWLKGIDSQKR